MTPAERQRRYRERKAAGLRAHRVYLDDAQVTMLVRHRLIDESALSDPDAFADQLGIGLEMMLSRVTHNE